MKRTVRVNAELLHCLCLYRCENNVKQFKNDIRLGCANAYLRAFHADEKEELPLYLNDFPSGVQRGLLYYKTYRKQLEELIPQYAQGKLRCRPADARVRAPTAQRFGL